MTVAVFIVEDEPSVQESLQVVLEGYLHAQVVGSACCEADAVAWLRANPQGWQLLVVDLTLRQGSGLGVLQALSTLGRAGGMVVALTNAATEDNRALCLRLGADAVFDKAAQINEFLAFCADGAPA